MSKLKPLLWLFFIAFFTLEGFSQPITKHALLVGIGDYPKSSGFSKIHGDADVDLLRQTLLKSGFKSSNIMALKNDQATKIGILIALRELARKAESGDYVYVHFSGHFQQIKDTSGVEMDSYNEAFVPYDAASKFVFEKYEGENHLTDDDLGRMLNLIRNKLTALGYLAVSLDGALSNKPSLPHRRGIKDKFQIPTYFIYHKYEKKAFDNEWLDLNYEQETAQLTVVDAGTQNCDYPEFQLKPGVFYGPISYAIQYALMKANAQKRFRDVAPTLSEISKLFPFPIDIKIDGNLSMPFIGTGISGGKELSEENTAPEKEESATFKNVHAVCIGVSSYLNHDSLQYAHTDAMHFHSYLVSAYGNKLKSDSSSLLINEKATKERINTALAKISNEIRERDLVYVFFAGHGDVENLITRKGHLLLYNAPSNVYKSGGTIPFDDIRDYLIDYISKKARVYLIIDACRSGRLAGGVSGQKEAAQLLQNIENRSARILSCQPEEKSMESEQFGGGNGAFTYYLLHGLEGNANMNKDEIVTVGEIKKFLADSVKFATDNRQNPLILGNTAQYFMPQAQFSLKNILQQTYSAPIASLAQNFDNTSKSDSIKDKLYKEFSVFLKKGNLVLPEKNNAYARLRSLNQQCANEPAFLNNLRDEYLNAVSDKHQKLLNAYIAGSQSAAKEEKYIEASLEMASVLEQTKVDAQLYFFYLARKYFFEGRSISPIKMDNDLARIKLKDAIGKLRTSLTIEPEGAHNYNAIGRLYHVNRQYDSAIFNYKKALLYAPTWKFPLNNLGAAFDDYFYLTRKKEYVDSAIFYYQKAIKIDAKYAIAIKNLAKTYYNSNQYSLSKKTLQYCIFISPDYPDAYNNLGDVYRLDLKYDSAEYYLRLGLMNFPEHIDLNTTMANLYYDKFNYAEEGSAEELAEKKTEWLNKAKALYFKTYRTDPFYKYAIAGLGNVYWSKDQFDSAAYYYKKYIELDSTTLDYRKAYLECEIRLGNIIESKIGIDRLLAKHPEDAGLYFDAGLIQVLMNSYTKAESYFAKAIKYGYVKEDFIAEPLLKKFIASDAYKRLGLK